MTLKEIISVLATHVGDNPNVKFSEEDYCNLLYGNSLKHFKQKIGLPEEYVPGMPLPRQAYEITKRITADLLPFKVSMGENSSPLFVTSGFATTPTNMYYPSTMHYNLQIDGVLNTINIDIVSDGEWARQLTSYIDVPNRDYPIANFQNGVIRFRPTTITRVYFVYLKKPNKPVYGVSFANGFLDYDSTTSTELEWDDVNTYEIIYKTLLDLSIILNRPDIAQIANKYIEKGV